MTTEIETNELLTLEEMQKAIPVDSETKEPLSQTFVKYIKQGNVSRPTPPASMQGALQPAAFRIQVPMGSPPMFERVQPKTDELFTYKDSVLEEVLEEIDKFWTLASKYKQYGFRHTRGILMHGKPGNGKSSAIQQVIERIVQRGDPVFLCDSVHSTTAGLRVFRDVEPDRKVVVILEDMDNYIGYAERDLLQLLDGDNAQDGILFIGTTNYLERFPARLKRSGRFDRKVEVGPPNESARTVYFSKKLKKKEDHADVQELVQGSDGMNFGDLKELVIATQVLGEPVDGTLERLRNTANESIEESIDEAARSINFTTGIEGTAPKDVLRKVKKGSKISVNGGEVATVTSITKQTRNVSVAHDTDPMGKSTNKKYTVVTVKTENSWAQVMKYTFGGLDYAHKNKTYESANESEEMGEALDGLSTDESQMVKHYFDFGKMKGGVQKSTGDHTDDARKVSNHPTIVAISKKLRLIHGKLERTSDRKERVKIVRDYMGPKLARYMKSEGEMEQDTVIEKFATGKNDSGSTTDLENHTHNMKSQATQIRKSSHKKRYKNSIFGAMHVGVPTESEDEPMDEKLKRMAGTVIPRKTGHRRTGVKKKTHDYRE